MWAALEVPLVVFMVVVLPIWLVLHYPASAQRRRRHRRSTRMATSRSCGRPRAAWKSASGRWNASWMPTPPTGEVAHEPQSSIRVSVRGRLPLEWSSIDERPIQSWPAPVSGCGPPLDRRCTGRRGDALRLEPGRAAHRHGDRLHDADRAGGDGGYILCALFLPARTAFDGAVPPPPPGAASDWQPAPPAHVSASELRYRVREMEDRLRAMEAYVTSSKYEIDRELKRGLL